MRREPTIGVVSQESLPASLTADFSWHSIPAFARFLAASDARGADAGTVAPSGSEAERIRSKWYGSRRVGRDMLVTYR